MTAYATKTQANSYFATTLRNASWTSIAEAAKEIALQEATNNLNKLKYIGRKQDEAQENEFPRYFNTSLNNIYEDDLSGIYNGTPNDVLRACCEEALWLVNNQNNKLADLKAMGIKSVSLGNESYSFEDGSTLSPIGSPIASGIISKWERKGFKVC